MNRLTTMLLLAFLLLLGLFYFYVSKTQSTTTVTNSSKPEAVRILSNFVPEEVSEYFFEDLKRGTRINFRKVSHKDWELTIPLVYAADNAVVKSMLDPFQYNECVVIADLAKAPQTKLEEYGLKVPRVVIRLTIRGENKAVLIGDEDVSGDKVFLLSENRILRTAKNIHNATQRTLDEFRSKQIFTTPSDQLREIEVDAENYALTFVLKGSTWQLELPWKEPADLPAMTVLLNQIYSLRVKRFYDDHPGPDAMYGLGAPAYRIVLRTADSQEEVKLAFGNAGVLVGKKTGMSTIWEMPEETHAAFDRKADEFRDHSFFNFFREDIAELRLGTPSGEVVFAQKMKNWALTSPREYPLDLPTFEDLLTAIQRMSATGFIDRNEKSWVDFGLEASPRFVQMLSRTGQTKKIWIGGVDGKGNRYVRREKEETVVLIPQDALPFIDGNVFDFVSRRFLEISEPELKRVELIAYEGNEKKSIAWDRDPKDGLWRRVGAAADAAGEEDSKFASQLDMFTHWKGERAVTDQAAAYHFEQPILEVRYFTGESGGAPRYLVPIVMQGSDKYFAAGKNNIVYEIPAKVIAKLRALFL